MKFLIFSLATVIAAARTVCAADEYPMRIPDAIAACYDNQSVSNRYNRLPHSLDSLIAIIRKIEAHADTEFWSVERMTGTILRRFRYDGIIDSPVVGPGLVPIKRDSVEADKYSLLWEVIPGHAADFPENSLTFEEKCSLHWMLSYSINSTQRLEEKPRQAARMVDEGAEGEETSGFGEDHHVVSHDLQDERTHRSPNEEIQDEEEIVGQDDAESELNEGHDHEHHHNKRDVQTQSSVPQSARPLQLGVIQTPYGTVAPGVVLAGIATGLDPQTVKLKQLIKDPTLEISEASMERDVHSFWAATLSGELAHTALLRASIGKPSVGPRGTWNCSICSRENVLPDNDHSMMTFAELYGGIDGLLMAQKIDKWNNEYVKLSHILEMYYSAQGVYDDPQYRACNRLNLFNSYVDKALLKEQALSAALVYYAKGMEGSPAISPQVKPADAIGVYVNTSFNEMIRFLALNEQTEMDFTQCQGSPEAPNIETPATYTDLTVVIDQYAEPRIIHQQKLMIAKLALLMDIQPGGSRMEIVSGNDGAPFVALGNITNKGELACKLLSLNANYRDRKLGDVLAKLRSTIAKEREFDRVKKVSGANSRTVVIFVAGWTAGTAEKDKMKVEYEKLSKEMPDVNLMFVTLVSAEDFRPFVKKFERDVIKMQNFENPSDIEKVANSLAQVPARLLYPACKDVVQTGESLFTYESFANPYTVQYFRLGAEHFFSSPSMTVSFKSFYGVNRFCWSRTNSLPGQKDTCSNAFKSNETVEFKFTQPCARLPNVADCQPIYFSVAPVGGNDNIPCSERFCHTPDQVKFIFQHEGLRCKSNDASSGLAANISLLGVLLLTLAMSSIA